MASRLDVRRRAVLDDQRRAVGHQQLERPGLRPLAQERLPELIHALAQPGRRQVVDSQRQHALARRAQEQARRPVRIDVAPIVAGDEHRQEARGEGRRHRRRDRRRPPGAGPTHSSGCVPSAWWRISFSATSRRASLSEACRRASFSAAWTRGSILRGEPALLVLGRLQPGALGRFAAAHLVRGRVLLMPDLRRLARGLVGGTSQRLPVLPRVRARRGECGPAAQVSEDPWHDGSARRGWTAVGDRGTAARRTRMLR